jgi:hypothetical protein
MHQDPLVTCDNKNMARGHNQYLPDADISSPYHFKNIPLYSLPKAWTEAGTFYHLP